MSLLFTKMHGLGNDFVLIDSKTSASKVSLNAELARRICDRRFGVGADQILWLRDPQVTESDIRMEIFNADGSIAEMCGNGIRAVGLYLSRYGSVKKPEYSVETLAGVQIVKVSGSSAVVNMGVPTLGAGFSGHLAGVGEPIEILGRDLKFFEVNVGNPHAVFFVENVDAFPVAEIGALVEVHPRFPNRTNVEFVEVLSPGKVKLRVWERGAGITLACGSGACATAAAAIALKKTSSEVIVALPGGELLLKWQGGTTSLLMEGPATEVFRGEFLL